MRRLPPSSAPPPPLSLLTHFLSVLLSLHKQRPPLFVQSSCLSTFEYCSQIKTSMQFKSGQNIRNIGTDRIYCHIVSFILSPPEYVCVCVCGGCSCITSYNDTTHESHQLVLYYYIIALLQSLKTFNILCLFLSRQH